MAEVITRFKVDTTQFDGKVKGAKKSLDDFGKSGKGAASGLSSLSSALGTNITKYASWTASISAAMKVMKDAIKSTESGMDELGRTTESVKGAYKSFLSTINGGNWNNFFRNISTAVQGARDLYDSLDRLGSIKNNNAAAIAIEQNLIQELRLRQQAGENVSDQIKTHSAKLKALQMQAVDAGKTAGREQIANVISTYANGVGGNKTFTKESLNKAVESILTGGQSTFDFYAGQLKELKRRGTKSVDTSYVTQDGTLITGKEDRFNINNLTSGEQAMYKLAYAITEGETEIKAGIDTFTAAIQEQSSANRELLKGNKYALSGAGGGSSFNNPYKYIKSLVGGGFSTQSVNGAAILDANLPTISASIDKMNIGTQYAKSQAFELADAWKQAANCIAMAGSAMQGIESPAARVTGILAEAIANIALGFGAAAANQGKSGNMWEWVAASISGAATMISTIAAVKQATKGYAQGGIVGSLGYGMSSSGDNIVARLNKGEGVLTRAGIDNAETLFSGGGIGGLHLETYISGEDLRIALVNNNRRRGGSRGEYAISRV